MYKGIAFFDLDRTLLNEHTKVDPEVAEAMKQLRRNGILPAISSGRNVFEIPDILAATGIDTAVLANGDYVLFEGKPLYEAIIDPELVKEFLAFGQSQDEPTTVLNSTGARVNFITDNMRSNYASINTPIPPLGTDDFIAHQPVYMMVINTVGHDQSYIKKFDQQLTFYRNTPYSMDVVVKNGSKKRGIQELISRAGLTGIPTYAFGDGNNDIPMLDFVDHAVVMGNGLDNVKPYAEFITTKNTDHGIVNGLKHYGLI